MRTLIPALWLITGLATASAWAQPLPPGEAGVTMGHAQRTRHLFNKAFLEALADDFRLYGRQAIEKVRKTQPAAYMKICALLVPREMKVEHSQGVKAMSDEEIEAAIELIKSMLEARGGDDAKVIEGTAERMPSACRSS